MPDQDEGRMVSYIREASGEVRFIAIHGVGQSITQWPLASATVLAQQLNECLVSAHQENAARAQLIVQAAEAQAALADGDESPESDKPADDPEDAGEGEPAEEPEPEG